MHCSICLSTHGRNVIPLQPGHELHNTACDTCKVRWVVEKLANECPFCKEPWLHEFIYDSLVGWGTFYHIVSNIFSRENIISVVYLTVLSIGAHTIVDFLFSLVFSGVWDSPMFPRSSPTLVSTPVKLQSEVDEIIHLLNKYLDRIMMSQHGLSQQCPNPHYVAH